MKAGLVGMTYAAMLVVFLAIDLLWLGVIARRFYLNHLGRFFAERVNWAAAFAFYLLFLAGMMIFAVQPALEQNSFPMALGNDSEQPGFRNGIPRRHAAFLI